MLRRIDFKELIPFRSAARNERVAVTNGSQDWYGWWSEGRLVAFGFVRMVSGRARIGGLYTRPDFRGQGHGAAMTAALMDIVEDSMSTFLDVYTVNPTWWAREHGLKPLSAARKGIQHMGRTL